MTINAYLVDTITIVLEGAIDDWGEPASGSEIDVPAYIVEKSNLVIAITGEQEMSSRMIYLPHWIQGSGYLARPLMHTDMIKINNVEQTILKIVEPKHFSDPHYEVYIK